MGEVFTAADVVDLMVVQLGAELDAVDAHLSRIDVKAGLLLGLAGAGAAAGLAVIAGAGVGGLAAVLAAVAVAAFAAAAVVAVRAVRPALRMAGDRGRVHGFPRYAGRPAEVIVADLERSAWSPRARAERLSDLAGLAARKYRLLGAAVDLICAGICAGLAAGVAAALSSLAGW